LILASHRIEKILRDTYTYVDWSSWLALFSYEVLLHFGCWQSRYRI